MGALEDQITEYKRMGNRDRRIAQLEEALASCVAAMKDVQDYWGDPGSFTHNRLQTPLLVYEHVISPDRS